MRESKAFAIVKDASASMADAICEEGAGHAAEIASFVNELAFGGAALAVAEGLWALWCLGRMLLLRGIRRGEPSEIFARLCLS